MNSANNSSQTAQPADSVRSIPGKRRGIIRKRLAAAHLSDPFRARVVGLMTVHESADRVADVLREEMPGLTGKTVLEVMVLALMRPPQPERGGFGLVQRRTA